MAHFSSRSTPSRTARNGSFPLASLLALALATVSATIKADPAPQTGPNSPVSVHAEAAPTSDEVIVQRTVVPPNPRSLGRADPDPELLALAQRIDAVVHEAVQDMGLTLDVSSRAELDANLTEEALVERAHDLWVVSPQIQHAPSGLVLRIVAVPPGSRVLYVRTQTISPEELEVRVVTMMRDLVDAGRGRARTTDVAPPPRPVGAAEPAHSPGRAILALNAALLGGFAGYSLQQASGSDDDRLTYPLVALGAGVGLGGSMLVADEWDIGVGEAWFLAAGMWWPALSGVMLAESYGGSDTGRYAYGLLGATSGVTLTAAVLGFRRVTEGGAALAHSGGAFGTLLGGLTELAIEGSTSVTPYRGMGFGAGGGLLLATALVTQVQPSASRVLLIDLAASLGALTGAAAGSPFLLVEEDADDANRNRLWLGSIALGTLIGAGVGYWTTRPPPSAPAVTAHHTARPTVIPSVGVVEVGPRGPALGATVRGTW